MAPSAFLGSIWDPPRPRGLDAEVSRPRTLGSGSGLPLGSWALESSGTIVACVQKLINTIEIPITFLHERLCQQHVVMVTLVFGNKHTNICIEVKEFQGGVRATSILCLLGIGLGVGSVLLYKLCTKILSPAIAAARGKKRPPSPGKLLPEHHLEAILSPETPDSGISTATTLTRTVSSCAVTPDRPYAEDVTFSKEGLRHRSTIQTPLRQISSPRKPARFGSHGSNDDTFPRDSFCLEEARPGTLEDLRRHNMSRRSGTFCSSVNSDQGFVSGHQVSSDGFWHVPSEQESVGGLSLPADLSVARWNHGHAESSYVYGGRLTDDRIFSPVTNERSHDQSALGVFLDYANYPQSGANHSTPQHEVEYSYSDLGDVNDLSLGDKPRLRRSTYSVGSNLSASTDFSMRESLAGKGYSIDLGESLSRLGTPVSSMFDKDSIAPSSTSNMDQLHREIRIIREEISEMNEKVQVLSSRENLQEMFMLTPDPMQETEFSQSLKVVQQKKLPNLSESRSCSVSVDGDGDDPSTWRRSHQHAGDFMWDYQSDLAVEDSTNFIAKRPLIGESAAVHADKIDYDSPTFDHVRKYIESCCDAQYDTEVSPSVHKTNRQTPKQSRTFSSITDMYIDDNFSEYGDSNEVGERNRPDGCQSMETSQIHSGENETSPKTMHKNLNHDAKMQKQLSFNKSFDCDNNGNPDTSVATYSVESEHQGGMEGSMCQECGSPSHRTKRQGSPATDPFSAESAFRSVPSPRSLQHSRPSSGADSSSPADTTAHRHKRRRWEVKNVNDKINIFEYAEREVKGDSPTSRVTKKGFHQIHGLLGMSQLRPIRGDNYCALRATLYQICINNYPVLKHLGPLDNVLRKLTLFQDPKYSFLHAWNFANRLPYAKDTVLERIQECVVCFYKQVEALKQLPTASAREAAFMEIVNFDPDTDLQFLEAIKVLMMVEAAEMYESYTGLGHRRAPVFAWLMYSRESSENPEALFRNHINCLGDISSAQQVELFLLGHTLGVKIEVVRPARYGNEDFISHYPDDGADSYPKVYLVAENDRIYHAVMK